MAEPVLEVQELDLSFKGLMAVNKVSFKVFPEEVVALIGPNGSGKTSVLNIINGVYRPDQGQVFCMGRRVDTLPPHEIAMLGIARVFQLTELFPSLTTLDNILVGCHTQMKGNVLSCGIYWWLHQKRELAMREWAEQVIAFFELGRYRNQIVANLPFGVQKLIGVARAFALRPRVILLDEPSTGMTRPEKENLSRFLLRIKYEHHIPMLWVEHDVELVGDLCDRVIVLSEGRKIAEGMPESVLIDPEVVEIYVGLKRAPGA